MSEYEIRVGTTDDRRLRPGALGPLREMHLGLDREQREVYVGTNRAVLGEALVPPLVGRTGHDVRRLWQVASQGQVNVWNTTRDGSGLYLTPRAAGSPGTDVLTTGVIGAGELADGGEVVITAVGTYKCGSALPRILAKLKIGGSYVVPQYEGTLPGVGVVDVSSLTADCFEWSSRNCGLNALGGYEALWATATNIPQGEFQWRLTMRIHALGYQSKWDRGDQDNTTNLRDRTCWVDATLEWGAFMASAGGRVNPWIGYDRAWATLNGDYNCTTLSTTRGVFYCFGGQMWLCHAGSATTAVTAGSPPTFDAADWATMLAEEAPGMGTHWREFWVPAVSKAHICGLASVAWRSENEIQLEMGGPQQMDVATVASAYGATTAYQAEVNTVLDSGTTYVAKTNMYNSGYPHIEAGVHVAQPTGAPPDARYWRALPATRADEMRVQTVSGYVFGRSPGVMERRTW